RLWSARGEAASGQYISATGSKSNRKVGDSLFSDWLTRKYRVRGIGGGEQVRPVLLVAVVMLGLVCLGVVRGAQAQEALSKARARGALTACVDPYNFPFSANNTEPPGFDIELVRAVAVRAGIGANSFWAD